MYKNDLAISMTVRESVLLTGLWKKIFTMCLTCTKWTCSVADMYSTSNVFE